MTTQMKPVHHGDVLDELFLKPLNMSPGALAAHLGLQASFVESLVEGKADLTVDTAMRLAKFFGTSPEVWMNMQGAVWDIEHARKTVDVSAITPMQMPADIPQDNCDDPAESAQFRRQA